MKLDMQRVFDPTCKVEIDGEEVRQFIAGLADNIGLGSTHAVRILGGAVAATTRSRFLQAWPEMEMVAAGLEKILKVEQRAHLLNMFGQTCGSENQSIAAAALGVK
ncbi:hypothetical protein Taro_003450 [Colocasia esculenta]|uniref:Uncharacterized protein n=1 Tax=Colocasia esculenta TaxID=4460 RepID=A0A843TH49_COLES|nr:hypothetical protein [Colocasia esculenta]